jgi:hypothetical protein
MASSAKKKTTFAKLNRENKLRERRQEKQARKDARKLEAATQRDEAAMGHVDIDADVEGDETVLADETAV